MFSKYFFQLIEERHVRSYNWIIANQELTVAELRTIPTNSKVLALSRKHLETVGNYSRGGSGTLEGVGREVEYLLDGLWVVRELVMTVFGQVEWAHAGHLNCSIHNTATFKDGDKLAAALKTTNIAGRSGSVRYISHR